MPRGLNVPKGLLIVNMIPFVNISNVFRWENIYIMASRGAHWHILNDSFAFQYAR